MFYAKFLFAIAYGFDEKRIRIAHAALAQVIVLDTLAAPAQTAQVGRWGTCTVGALTMTAGAALAKHLLAYGSGLSVATQWIRLLPSLGLRRQGAGIDLGNSLVYRLSIKH